MIRYINISFMLFLFLVLTSCESSNSLIMDRGSYFYKNENYNEAANQFNKVILSYPQNINLLRSKDIEILAHAYQQLALCQSKLAILSNDMTNKKIYFNEAIENIKKAERLVIKPQKREEYRKTHLGIKFQLESL